MKDVDGAASAAFYIEMLNRIAQRPDFLTLLDDEAEEIDPSPIDKAMAVPALTPFVSGLVLSLLNSLRRTDAPRKYISTLVHICTRAFSNPANLHDPVFGVLVLLLLHVVSELILDSYAVLGCILVFDFSARLLEIFVT